MCFKNNTSSLIYVDEDIIQCKKIMRKRENTLSFYTSLSNQADYI